MQGKGITEHASAGKTGERQRQRQKAEYRPGALQPGMQTCNAVGISQRSAFMHEAGAWVREQDL